MAIFEKPLFIFEMANNHQGSVEHGKKIIREMKRITTSYEEEFNFAIKFQYRDLDTFIHPDYMNRQDVNHVKRFQDTRLTQEQFLELKREAEELGMYTICTPFDEVSVNRVVEHNYDVIKIASCSFTDWTLLEKIAGQNKPVIASGAGSSLEDIDRVVNFFRHRNVELALMHCIAEYPVKPEHLQMNQITLYQERYPGLHIGFSTHESPDNMEPIKVAIAKGAQIFEKHVGVETDTTKLNGYSARPDQVEQWLNTARNTYQICGVSGSRYVPNDKELADLAALQRGAFAAKKLKPGQRLDMKDLYLAFPCREGQVLASDLSKYISLTVKESFIGKDKPIMLEDITVIDDTARIREIVSKIVVLLKKSNVVIPINSTCEISHHYGKDVFEETGVTMINCINREYCKKILVVLPGQAHPAHLHQQKEETFTILYGSLIAVCDGVEQRVSTGESMIVERGVNHSFRSEEGCVFEEISTTHFGSDSYYEEEAKFVSPRKTKIYITKEMMKDFEL